MDLSSFLLAWKKQEGEASTQSSLLEVLVVACVCSYYDLLWLGFRSCVSVFVCELWICWDWFLCVYHYSVLLLIKEVNSQKKKRKFSVVLCCKERKGSCGEIGARGKKPRPKVLYSTYLTEGAMLHCQARPKLKSRRYMGCGRTVEPHQMKADIKDKS